ncbi:hypothetical protein O181_040653 [Austropuccinia psidii MF-1]|uniref:Uncharacterized protein n=1 Tax=Austropuccinia psidii MF-1 TaxID=1389203 RepID=A0A9Q3DHM3_9BASI|nr:hypothetical protein [Austropuccinia psidii MF-1]
MQKNRAVGKKFGIIIQIQEPKSPWEISHMDWVTGLPPGGDRSINACLVLVGRYRKSSIFFPCHKNVTAMDKAMMIWNRVIIYTATEPQIDGPAEAMITTLDEMIRLLCAYGLDSKTLMVLPMIGVPNSSS